MLWRTGVCSLEVKGGWVGRRAPYFYRWPWCVSIFIFLKSRRPRWEEIHRRSLGRDPDARFSFNGPIVVSGDGIALSWGGAYRGSLETLAEVPPRPPHMDTLQDVWSLVGSAQGQPHGWVVVWGRTEQGQVEGELRALQWGMMKGSPRTHPQMCQPELGNWLGWW